MDGGAYGYRTPGSPRHWGEEVPGNVPKLVGTGNGSPCGIMVYEGSLLPGAYKGCLFEADAGTRQINFFPIERHGSNFRTEYKVLLGQRRPLVPPGQHDRRARRLGLRRRLVRRRASAATPSATRTPAGSTGSPPRGTSPRSPGPTSPRSPA